MFTKLIVKYENLQFIRNAILNLSLVPAEKRVLELSHKSTVEYLNSLIEKHSPSSEEETHLIEIELNTEDDLSYIVNDIERIESNNLSFNVLFGCNSSEYRYYELWKLKDLIKDSLQTKNTIA